MKEEEILTTHSSLHQICELYPELVDEILKKVEELSDKGVLRLLMLVKDLLER